MAIPEKIVLYNRCYERFADFKGAILKFFAKIKQYRSELESLMILNFHTLGVGVCCLLRRNLEPRDRHWAKIALAQLFSFIFFKNE